MKNLNSNYDNPPVDTGEKLSKKRLVETGGYVSPSKSIENLIQAGIRFETFQKEQALFGEEGATINRYGYDLAELSEMNQSVKTKVNRFVKERSKFQKKHQETPPVSSITPPESGGGTPTPR